MGLTFTLNECKRLSALGPDKLLMIEQAIAAAMLLNLDLGVSREEAGRLAQSVHEARLRAIGRPSGASAFEPASPELWEQPQFGFDLEGVVVGRYAELTDMNASAVEQWVQAQWDALPEDLAERADALGGAGHHAQLAVVRSLCQHIEARAEAWLAGQQVSGGFAGGVRLFTELHDSLVKLEALLVAMDIYGSVLSVDDTFTLRSALRKIYPLVNWVLYDRLQQLAKPNDCKATASHGEIDGIRPPSRDRRRAVGDKQSE